MIESISAAVRRVETAVLCALLLSILALAGADIVGRNLFSSGLEIAGPVIRVLVLWLGMCGALYATGLKKHIAINVADQYLSGAAQQALQLLTQTFATLVCALLAWSSAEFVLDSYRYEDIVFGSFPAWIAQLIIPLAFAGMAVRFGLHSFGALQNLKSRGSATCR